MVKCRKLGIPFAEPPVGDRRWREPVPVQPWSGVREASAFGSPCAQPVMGDWNRHDAENSKEDCLYLNVVTPEWPARKPLPVMVWIPGGSNEGGSGTGPLFNDGTLVRHGVLLVTINYRLGVFGFFSHAGLSAESTHHVSGNYGLMDQILALHWVLENIASFGGDPTNITLFGESAGSADLGWLMTSPLAKNLFQRAIAESGSPIIPAPEALTREAQGAQFAAHLPGSPTTVKALRQLPAKDLLAAQTNREARPSIGPFVDGWVITQSPASVFAGGQESPIPLLFGTTSRQFGGGGSSVSNHAGGSARDDRQCPGRFCRAGAGGLWFRRGWARQNRSGVRFGRRSMGLRSCLPLPGDGAGRLAHGCPPSRPMNTNWPTPSPDRKRWARCMPPICPMSSAI
jgi:para-nitrobenzyl esterase